MENLLRLKQKAGQGETSGAQSSVIGSKHRSHSYPQQRVLRSHDIPSVDFGSKVTTSINSRNMVTEMFLTADLAIASGANMNYSKDIGNSLCERIRFRFQGREFLEIDRHDQWVYHSKCASQDVKRDDLISLCGGAKSGAARTVVCWIPTPWSQWHNNLKSGMPGFVNGSSSSKLELEIQFSAKADVADDNAACSMSNVKLHYFEFLTPVSIEKGLPSFNQQKKVLTYNTTTQALAAGVETKVDLSGLVASGSIRQLLVHLWEAAQQTGADRDLYANAYPTRVRLVHNGKELFDESTTILRASQRLFESRGRDAALPFCLPFCVIEEAQKTSSANNLPVSSDKVYLYLTATAACDAYVVAELEKNMRTTSNGRIEFSD